jgi:hypothetical protein
MRIPGVFFAEALPLQASAREMSPEVLHVFVERREIEEE